MSQQPPYALHPRRSRAPEHAAILSANAALRGRVRRAMKLVLIVSVWMTGFCSVVAAVTLVAVATAPIGRSNRGISAATVQQGPAGGGRSPVVTRAGGSAGPGGHAARAYHGRAHRNHAHGNGTGSAHGKGNAKTKAHGNGTGSAQGQGYGKRKGQGHSDGTGNAHGPGQGQGHGKSKSEAHGKGQAKAHGQANAHGKN